MFATLAEEDLVHTDAEGAISVAYPFSACPRGHRVLIDNTRTVEAMCVIDALGIAPMLNLPIELVSHDPVSGADVWVRLYPGEGAWWEPETAVVLAGSCNSSGPSFRGSDRRRWNHPLPLPRALFRLTLGGRLGYGPPGSGPATTRSPEARDRGTRLAFACPTRHRHRLSKEWGIRFRPPCHWCCNRAAEVTFRTVFSKGNNGSDRMEVLI